MPPRRKTLLTAIALLAVAAAVCLWYTRPQSWTEVAGAESATSLAGSAMASDIDYSAGYSQGTTDVWKLDAEQAEGEAMEAILAAFQDSSYRARLINPIRALFGRKITETDVEGSIHLVIVWNDPRWATVVVYSGGLVRIGGWIAPRGMEYQADSGLYQRLAELFQTYGTPVGP